MGLKFCFIPFFKAKWKTGLELSFLKPLSITPANNFRRINFDPSFENQIDDNNESRIGNEFGWSKEDCKEGIEYFIKLKNDWTSQQENQRDFKFFNSRKNYWNIGIWKTILYAVVKFFMTGMSTSLLGNRCTGISVLVYIKF